MSVQKENFEMEKTFVLNIGWIAAASILGFAITAIFAGYLHLPRSIFLVVYLMLAAPFLYAFFSWSRISFVELLQHNWVLGLVAAVLIGAFTVRNILSQPASDHSQGLSLIFDIGWLGIVYGGLDALFLSVLPVLATWQAFSALGWTSTLPGKIATGVIALIASLVVTVAYHLGYPEYRVPGSIMGPSIGNGVMSIGYILTNNPLPPSSATSPCTLQVSSRAPQR
jgi:MFS family permease